MQGLGDSDLYRVRRQDTMESSSEEGTVERKPRSCQMNVSAKPCGPLSQTKVFNSSAGEKSSPVLLRRNSPTENWGML